MIDLDDLLAIDDTPRGAVVTGGLSVGEPCASSAELEAWAEMYADPAYQRASEILFVDEDEQNGTVEFLSAARFANLMGGVTPLPDQAAVAAWQAELMAECWRRYSGAILTAREHG